MLTLDNTVLLVIDLQGRLASIMSEKVSLFENIEIAIKGAKILNIPILWTEQIPEKLGPTIPEISQLLSPLQPIAKNSFSCCGNEDFIQTLKALNRKQILLTGIEAHICVYQTARDLVNLEYDVQVIADAVSSRTADNKKIGLERMRDIGASIIGTEMALFELLKVAEGAKFKQILNIVK
ncbi:hydrolase [candidate division WOR-3 bacterium]|nr:hydrolase [candidate division WOR-3 bacterium]